MCDRFQITGHLGSRIPSSRADLVFIVVSCIQTMTRLPTLGIFYHSQRNIWWCKPQSYWTDNAQTSLCSAKIGVRKSSKGLFRNLKCILRQIKRSPLPSGFDPIRFPHISFSSEFFTDKIRTIRNCFPQTIPSAKVNTSFPPGTPFETFKPATKQLVREVIQRSVPKTCELGPILTTPLYEDLDVLLPTITNIMNHSLTIGTVPSDFKTAVVF